MPQPRTILIILDKFKGTLTASAAAEAVASGWCKTRPTDRLNLLPMSDGGDGFGLVFSNLLRAKPQTLETVDAAHRPCRATWWWDRKTKTAIIESANVIGLAMLPPGKFHPFQLDTAGLGMVIRAAALKGARRCLIGMGGSATNDGGFGLAQALGWKFSNNYGEWITDWPQLDKLEKIQASRRRRWFNQLVVAVDVQNPLLGVRGATRVYGPQKGLRETDFDQAERCLRRLEVRCKQDIGRDCARIPGAGAAGGLGFGLLSFLGARMEPGFDLFARYAELDQRLRTADLVITGEGCIDRSTFMGKGVGEVIRRCHEMKIPCLGVCGVLSEPRRAKRHFALAHALSEMTTVQNAKSNSTYWLERLVEQMAREWTAKQEKLPRTRRQRRSQC